jgi:protein gp37
MSKIEWTHRPGTKSEVWNPTTGCDKVSQGCKNCYAEIMHKRLRGMGQKKYQQPFLGHLTMHDNELLKPLSWGKPRTVFVNSMSDLFHKDVSDAFLDKVFAVMVICHEHTFQILTKRADRMCEYFSVGKTVLVERWANAIHELGVTDKSEDPDIAHCWVHNMCEEQWPRPNIWLGVSAEDQPTFDERHYHLSKVPAYVRFISYEPALGPIIIPKSPAFSWLICGGESGHKARPAHPDWFRSVRDQCKTAGVNFFFKQHGAWTHAMPKPSGTTGAYCIFYNHGQFVKLGYYPRQFTAFGGVILEKVGKKESGNVLDGKQHLEFPG